MQRPTTAARRDGFITRRFLFSLGAALLALVPAVVIPAYGDLIYLSLTGITGEVTTKGYEKTIAVGSIQWGAGRGISWGPDGSGGYKATLSPNSVSEVTTTKSTDSTSAFLFERLTLGTVTSTAKFTIVTDAGLKRLEVELGNAYLSGFSQSAGAGGGAPSESLSLNFQTIKVTPYDAAGTAGTAKTWNLPANTP